MVITDEVEDAQLSFDELLMRIRTEEAWLLQSDIDDWTSLLHNNPKPPAMTDKTHFHLGEDLPVIPKGKILEIRLVNHNHWVVASNIFSPTGGLSIYDSAFGYDLPVVFYKSIAEEVCSTITAVADKRTEIDFPMVRQQLKDGDCGPFALAYSAALCFGIHPESIDVGGNSLRNNLACIYEKRKITLDDFEKVICAKNCELCRRVFAKNLMCCPDLHNNERKEAHSSNENPVRLKLTFDPD